MNYTIYHAESGKVISLITCPPDMLYLNIPEACLYIEGTFPSLDFYINEGVPVKKSKAKCFTDVFNYLTKEWEDLRSLKDFKDLQWKQIKQARTQAEYTGFTWEGSTFDSDAVSQSRITGAVTLAQMSASFEIDWILADNSVRTLNQVEMLQVGAALGNHVAEQFSKGVILRNAIDAATSKEEVESILWS